MENQMTEEEILKALKALPKRQRIALVAKACEELAHNLGPTKPGADADENVIKAHRKAQYRFDVIWSEAGNDSTMWGEEMENLYTEKPMSEKEEFISSLFAVGRYARLLRPSRIHRLVR